MLAVADIYSALMLRSVYILSKSTQNNVGIEIIWRMIKYFMAKIKIYKLNCFQFGTDYEKTAPAITGTAVRSIFDVQFP